MPWWVVYRKEDGGLWGDTSDPAKIASQSALNNRELLVAGPFTDAQHAGVWNRTTLSYDPAPTAPVFLPPDEFLFLFTPPEFFKIFQSTDDRLFKFRTILQCRNRPINLLGDRVQQALLLIRSLGLFDDQTGPGTATTRPAAILAYRPVAEL